MAKSNRDKIGSVLELLNEGLIPFVEREMKSKYEKDWITHAQESMREAHIRRDDPSKLHWDTQALLAVLWNQWNPVFRNILGHAERSLVSELRDIRNNWAHQKAFSSDDTYRAMDSMARLLAAVSAGEQVVEIERQKMEVMRLKLSEQTRHDAKRRASKATEGKPAAGLKPWREIIEPHPDVASGTYQQAEFAADLYQVYTNIATPEYGDPIEFFRRTYLTQGLRDLLSNAVLRLSKNQGDPVVALQTNFGGGKTHSMLALFHLFAGLKASELPNVDEFLVTEGLSDLPKACRAVLVGQYISPGEIHTMPDNTKVRTLWGELAWQLGQQIGKAKEIYKIVEEADKTGTNPGESMIKVFDTVGPCIILIDEWVAYARGLYEKYDLPAGSFETQFTFAQALTEAVAASKNTLLVVSVPSSDIEVGGSAGKEALTRLVNVVARKEATWQPASTEEGFEIVRRRLFMPITDPELFRARDAVIRAFIDNYRANQKDFPTDTSKADYEKRMTSAYPIHPDIFDRLHKEWSTLDRFQRTRGVLRMMAAVIHELWEKQDGNLLILPGMIPMEEPSVRKELTRYLEPAWQAIIETDVDGSDSVPLSIDQDNNTLGRYSATRRVARTIFLGTAPLKGTTNRGKDIRQINIGCVQPGESLPTFGDALRRLQNKSTYLNTDGKRSYYDTAQNINRDAESRKASFSDSDVQQEIERLLKEQEHIRGDFARVHACTFGPSDISDRVEDDALCARLVILSPESVHVANSAESEALRQAKVILESRGSGPRIFRNTLAFMAADKTRLADLSDAVRWAMAWKQINDKKNELDLNQSQIRTVTAKQQEWQAVVQQRIPEAYCWLIVPSQSTAKDPVEWITRRLKGNDALAIRAGKRMRADELLLTQLGAVRLRLELDRVPLWRGNDVKLRQLIEDFGQYLYLPRLQRPNLLVQAVTEGISMLTWSSDSFAYAEEFDDEHQRYMGLHTGETVHLSPESHGRVVKPDIAESQRKAEAAETGDGNKNGDGMSPSTREVQRGGVTANNGESNSTDVTVKPKRFYGSAELDATRLGRDAGQVAVEVLSHITGISGAKVKVRIEIEATAADGFDPVTVRTVTENCHTLKFQSFEFENE